MLKRLGKLHSVGGWGKNEESSYYNSIVMYVVLPGLFFSKKKQKEKTKFFLNCKIGIFISHVAIFRGMSFSQTKTYRGRGQLILEILAYGK